MTDYEIIATKNGKWIAYRTITPMFCFVADSQDELKEKIDRASKFYCKTRKEEIKRYG